MATLTDTAGERVMGRTVSVTDEVSGEEEERNWMKDAENKSKKILVKMLTIKITIENNIFFFK